MLAEAGAEVIKIERPGGEDMRRFQPLWGTESVSFALLNRGKKSVAADLKDPRLRDHILALAKTADVVVEQFRPGVMDRLGLGYQAFRAANPRIVYCAITGYGQTGPRSSRAGHDLNYIGDAGLLALSSGMPGHRVVPPALVADIAGGAYPAVMNILLALRQRERAGTAHVHRRQHGRKRLSLHVLGARRRICHRHSGPAMARHLLTGGTPRYRLYETRRIDQVSERSANASNPNMSQKNARMPRSNPGEAIRRSTWRARPASVSNSPVRAARKYPSSGVELVRKLSRVAFE